MVKKKENKSTEKKEEVKKLFYRYRLFSSLTAFNVYCEVETQEELWDVILKSKNDELNVELFHGDVPINQAIGLNIRPSSIFAIDAPFGTDAVSTPSEEELKNRPVPRVSQGRVVINPNRDSARKKSKNSYSKQKQKR